MDTYGSGMIWGERKRAWPGWTAPFFLLGCAVLAIVCIVGSLIEELAVAIAPRK